MKTQLRQLAQTLSTRTTFKGRVRLVRVLASYLQPATHPTLCRMPNHTLMMLDLRDPMQSDIYYGLYETGLQQLIRSLLEPGMIFFDLGAHVGFYTLTAAQRVGNTGAVHAFEPLYANATLLEQSVAANHFTQVRVNRVAVAEDAGTVTLHVPNSSAHNASGFATLMDFFPDAHAESVPALSLDAYVQAHSIPHIDFIKMDIEAAEVLALRGMKKILSAARKPRILSEVNVPRLQDAGYAPTILYQILAGYGYTPYRIAKQTLVVAADTSQTALLENVLFLPPSDPLLENFPHTISFARLTHPH